MHLPWGLPTVSWEEASSTHQAGLGWETSPALPRHSIHPSILQCVDSLGQALQGLGHQRLSTPQPATHPHCMSGPGLELNTWKKDGNQLSHGITRAL